MSAQRFLFLLAVCLLLAVPAFAGTGYWTPLGPSGSFTPSSPIYTHPGAPGTVWVNLYKSTDHGTTWSWASAPFPSDYIYAIAPDPSAPGAVWAAGSTRLLHSRGNGAPWVQVSNATYAAELKDESPESLITAQEAPGAVYMTTYRRLLGSLDGGATWRTLLAIGEDEHFQQVVPAAPGILYAVTDERFLKTRNNGRTWMELACPVPSPAGCSLDQIITSQGAVFATLYGEAGLLRSTDGGSTWQTVLGGGPDRFGILSLLKNPQFPGTLWATADDPAVLWLSLDNGVTWTRRNGVPAGRLAASGPEASVLYAHSDTGIARSINGGRTWVNVFPVIRDPDRPPSRVSFQPGNPSRMAFIYSHELFLSKNGGKTWKWVSGVPGSVNDVVIDSADPNRMYAVGSYTAVITTNGGRTWFPAAGPDDYVELLVRGRGKTLFAGGWGILRSRDNGKTWLRVLPESTQQDGEDLTQIVQKLVVDPKHPDFVYALVFLFKDFYPNHGSMNNWPSILWQSRDGGRSWKKIAEYPDAFALDPESSRLWMARGSEVLASDDRGASWQLMSRVPMDGYDNWITDLAVPPGQPGTLYLIHWNDLLRTRDEGRTWESIAAGGDLLLELAPGDPRTVFGMSHEGFFQMRLPE